MNENQCEHINHDSTTYGPWAIVYCRDCQALMIVTSQPAWQNSVSVVVTTDPEIGTIAKMELTHE